MSLSFGDAGGLHDMLVVDPNGDTDRDGFSNDFELWLGTNPHDSQSIPTFHLTVGASYVLPGKELSVDVAGAIYPTYLLFGRHNRREMSIPGFSGDLWLATKAIVSVPMSIHGRVKMVVPNSAQLLGRFINFQAVSLSAMRISNMGTVTFADPNR